MGRGSWAGTASDLEGRAGTRTIRISSGIENRAATGSAGTVRGVSLRGEKNHKDWGLPFLKLLAELVSFPRREAWRQHRQPRLLPDAGWHLHSGLYSCFRSRRRALR